MNYAHLVALLVARLTQEEMVQMIGAACAEHDEGSFAFLDKLSDALHNVEHPNDD